LTQPIFNTRYSYDHEKISDLITALSGWLDGWEDKLDVHHVNPDFLVPDKP
jgi:hypothetical protein